MNKKDTKEFVNIFTKHEPKKVIEAMNLINDLKSKSISDLEIALQLTNNEKIKNIIKLVMKMNINNL